MSKLKVKAGFLKDLVNRTYETHPRRLREAVSNAIDAGAEEVLIEITPKFIRITDDGMGMTSRGFTESFLAIGGSTKREDDTKIGRIGIGFLAIARFGSKITVTSATEEEGKFSAKIDLAHLLLPKNAQKDLIEEEIAEMITPVTDVPPFVKRGGNFTSILIEDLNPGIVNYFCEEDLEWVDELRRILPLDFSNKKNVISELKSLDSDKLFGGDARKVLDFFTKGIHHKIQVTLDILSANGKRSRNVLERLTFGDSQFDKIEQIIPICFEIPRKSLKPIQVVGYALDFYGTNWRKKRNRREWQGFLTRVKNVAVTENGYLGMKTGSGPQRYRVTGELFISGLNEPETINIDRVGFDLDSDEMVLVSEYLDRYVSKLFEMVQQESDRRSREKNKERVITIQPPIFDPPNKGKNYPQDRPRDRGQELMTWIYWHNRRYGVIHSDDRCDWPVTISEDNKYVYLYKQSSIYDLVCKQSDFPEVRVLLAVYAANNRSPKVQNSRELLREFAMIWG